jgi:ketopantoate reductase
MKNNIYVLKEHIMNGTVTMDVMVSGVKAKSFKEAVKKMKAVLSYNKNANFIITTETDNRLVFDSNRSGFHTVGILSSDEILRTI